MPNAQTGQILTVSILIKRAQCLCFQAAQHIVRAKAEVQSLKQCVINSISSNPLNKLNLRERERGLKQTSMNNTSKENV